MGSFLSTSALVGLATILLVVMAILILIAGDRVRKISGYNSNNSLKTVNDRLYWAQIFAWIAAAVGLILVLGYVALHFIEFTEWIHLILWILLFAALITSGVLLAIALNDLNNANVTNNNGSSTYMWWALVVGIIAMVVLLISGGWRAVQKTTETSEGPYYYMPSEANGPSDAAPMPPATSGIQVSTSGTYPGEI